MANKSKNPSRGQRDQFKQNKRQRSKYNRSKNNSSEVRNSSNADMRAQLPNISNTGKINSRKMAEIGHGKWIEGFKINLYRFIREQTAATKAS